MPSSGAPGMGGEAMSSSAIVVESVTGKHVLKIQGYSLTNGLINGESIKSTTFDVGGHRWFIKYYPNGYGSDNAGWIMFSLHVQDSDASEVKACFKISPLDEMGEPVQLYDNDWSVIRTFKTRCVGWGYGRFMERKALDKSTYLKDDCFRVRCDIIVHKEIRAEDTSTQFVVVPPSDMHHHISRLLSSGAEADVTFQVGEESFATHRLLLGARSSVFMAELFGPMKEKHTSNIQIHDMEPRVFKAMLHYIYNDSLPEMDMGDASALVQHLLVAADRYDLERLKLICEDKLSNHISTGTVATTLALAVQHSCKGLKEACFKFLRSRSNLKALMESDEFQHLTRSCPSLLGELLANVAP